MINKKEIKLVFMGTPEFSAKILDGLLNDGYDIIGVITEPDKPTGRKMEVLPTPVKKFALEKGLKLFQPSTKAEVQLTTYNLQPDIVVVAAYGKIITAETLEIPKYGCVNFHASLLPALRGPSPVQSAILEGLDKTGVTIMIMDENMDTGPMLSQVEITLDSNETATTLRAKMLEKGLPLLLKTLKEYIAGEIKPKKQENKKATYCKMINKEDGRVDFSSSAEIEERKTRAFNEWPGVYAFFGEKRIKFLEVGLSGGNTSATNDQFSNYKNGEVFLDVNGDVCVSFAQGYWVINRLQLEGKKETTAHEFLNGHKSIIGSILR
ncbi:MAG TPA: methionyl-tRNA formyltransferase [Patescibacteria group bacterium]|nr:methionyl-tRNA formyltransferase [Patescibacteria group bacterium]